jgi:glutaredoxin-like protein NrdH
MTRTVTVFSKPDCVQCDWTKKVFNKRGIPFTERDVTVDKEAKEVLELNGFIGVPVVKVDIDRDHADIWKGFKIDKLNGLDPRDYT